MSSVLRPSRQLAAVRAPWWLFPPSPLVGALLSVVIATAPDMRASLHIGYAGIAALYLAQTVGTVGGAGVAGVSPWRVFRPVPMCVLGTGALLLTFAVSDVVGLIPLLFLAGFAGYALNSRAQADISLIEGENRARALGLFHVFGGIGAFLFPVMFAVLIRAGVSWRGAFLLVSCFFAAYGVACLRWTHSGDPPGLRFDALRRVVHGRAGSALLVAVGGAGLQLSVVLWIPILMHDRFHRSTAAASVTAAIYMLALLLARVASTIAVNRIGGRLILILATGAVVAGHVVLFAAPTAAALLLAAVLVGAGSGPVLPVGIARVAQWSQDDRLGTATVMALVGPAQILLVSSVLAVHTLGVSLQHAAAITIVPAAVMLLAARNA